MFYYAVAQVTLRDIAQVAAEFGRRTERIESVVPGGQVLNIYLGDRDFVQWIPLDKDDLTDFDEEDRILVDRIAPASIWMIRHHYFFYPQLRYLLHRLLEMYGGVVSTEDGDPDPEYTVDTILELRYPADYVRYMLENHLPLVSMGRIGNEKPSKPAYP